MPEVNKEAIAEWVAALRSGDYEQATGTLSREKKYCCLGVACEIFADRVGVTRRPDSSNQKQEVVTGYSWSDGEGERVFFDELPPPVFEFLGLHNGNPAMNVGSGRAPLTTVNDEWGWDFNKIADIIENNYLKGNVDADSA